MIEAVGHVLVKLVALLFVFFDTVAPWVWRVAALKNVRDHVYSYSEAKTDMDRAIYWTGLLIIVPIGIAIVIAGLAELWP